MYSAGDVGLSVKEGGDDSVCVFRSPLNFQHITTTPAVCQVDAPCKTCSVKLSQPKIYGRNLSAPRKLTAMEKLVRDDVRGFFRLDYVVAESDVSFLDEIAANDRITAGWKKIEKNVSEILRRVNDAPHAGILI